MARPNKKWVPGKVDPLFKDMVQKTALERIKKGVDKKLSNEQRSMRRFTKAMTRYKPLWEVLKEANFTEEPK